MKSRFIIAITICLILLLTGCGSSPSSKADNNDETAVEYEEQSENATDGDYFGLGDQEIVIEQESVKTAVKQQSERAAISHGTRKKGWYATT